MPLADARIRLRLGRAVQAVLLLVGDDADDGDPGVVVLRPAELDPLATTSRRSPRKYLLRERFVDDRHARLIDACRRQSNIRPASSRMPMALK